MQESFLELLPNEIKLNILGYLDDSEIRQLKLLNQFWNNFIKQEFDNSLYSSLLKFIDHEKKYIHKLENKFAHLHRESRISLLDYYLDNTTQHTLPTSRCRKISSLAIAMASFTIGAIYSKYLYDELNLEYKTYNTNSNICIFSFLILVTSFLICAIFFISSVEYREVQTWRDIHVSSREYFNKLKTELNPEKNFLTNIGNNSLNQLYNSFAEDIPIFTYLQIKQIFNEISTELKSTQEHFFPIRQSYRLKKNTAIDLNSMDTSRQDYLKSRLLFWREQNPQTITADDVRTYSQPFLEHR